MKRFAKLSVFVCSIFLASAAFAAERNMVIIVVDPESGLALVPEDTPMPHGLKVLGRDGKTPLAFATAPAERFAEARRLIEATAGLEAQTHSPFLTFEPGAREPRAAHDRFAVRTNTTTSDVTYYVTFYDGSYISARRYMQVRDQSAYGTSYSVQTAAYTPETDYASGSISVSQSSATHTGFNVSATCTIGSVGGYCSTPTYGYSAGPNFSAQVTSTGKIYHKRNPICGRYGEPPCNEYLNGTIQIYFP
jgi:hypothetical protein